MPGDNFQDHEVGVSGPARRAAVITPDNSATGNLENYARAVWVPTAGNIAVVMAGQSSPSATDGIQVTMEGVPAGTLLPIQIRRVQLTGTTVTGNMIALY